MGRIVIALLGVFALPAFAAAQSRGGAGSAPGTSSPAAHGSAAAPRVSAPHATTAPRAAVPQTSGRPSARLGSPMLHRGGRPARRGTSVPFNSDQVDFQNGPGLGFDYAHLAAISGNRRRGARFNGGFPFGFSGFLLSPPVIVEEVPAAEPAVEEEASADGAFADPERSTRSRAHSAAPRESVVPSAPQPDVEQYVFVRRDGSLVFAVAYSWDNGTLRYVTPEGFRRTIASDALDLAATQQFNEQRGLTFRSPA